MFSGCSLVAGACAWPCGFREAVDKVPIPVPWASSTCIHSAVSAGGGAGSDKRLGTGAGAERRGVPPLLPGVGEAAHPGAASQVGRGRGGEGEEGQAGTGGGCSPQHLCLLSEQVPGGNDFLDAGIRTFQGP